jgi:ribonuclease P protein component
MHFIKKKRDYQNVYADYSKHYGNLFLFLIGKKSTDRPFSVGIIVSKKVGNAVHRNKVKRRVRSFFRQLPEELPFGVAGVIIALPSAAIATWADTEKDLSKLIRKCKQ